MPPPVIPPGRTPATAAQACAGALLLMLAGPILLANARLWLGFPPSWLAAEPLLSLLAAAAFLSAAAGPRRGAAAALFGAVAALCWAATVVPDISWDGRAYHQLAAIKLASGWNPLVDPPIAGTPDFVIDLHLNHFPRGAPTFAAGVFRLLGELETGKAYQGISLAAATLCCRAALGRWGLSPRRAQALAALAALSPVAACQWSTFLVDAALGSTLACLAATLSSPAVLWHQRIMLGCAVLIATQLKLTGLGYAAAFLLLGWGCRAALQRRLPPRGELAVGLGALLLGAAWAGYHPYVVNLRRHGDLFYPMGRSAGALYQRDTTRLIKNEAAPGFLRRDRVSKLLLSVFSECDGSGRSVRLRPPWIVRARDSSCYAGESCRIGGFGPLFGLCLLLGAAAAARLAMSGGTGRAWTLGAAALMATVLLNPEAWWARFAPQLWLVPCLALAGLAALSRPAALDRTLRWLLGAALAADAAFVWGSSLWATSRRLSDLPARMALLRAAPGPLRVRWGNFVAVGEAFSRAGIAFVEDPLCPHRFDLIGIPIRACREDGAPIQLGLIGRQRADEALEKAYRGLIGDPAPQGRHAKIRGQFP